MKPIKTLEELREQASEESITRIITEYMMELVGKADKLDAITDIINKNGTIKDIKSML